ncbi:MAG TPA: SsrA-binding protein SmpB [Actinomycetota bacterium]|nr:SsrA-binding protein SmpB [Actinomycetota bacterium]
MAEGEKTVVSNRKAFHDYAIEDRYEAGIVLRGAEVKALREARATIRDAYGAVKDGEVWLLGMQISPYSAQSTHEQLPPERPRKLLLKRGEIERLQVKIGQKGYTLVPLRVYFSHGLAKVELGLGRGKRAHDRREAIAERDAKREVERELRRRDR